MIASDKPKSLHNTMIKQGHFLFRWRGQIPLFFLLPAMFAVYSNFHFERLVNNDWEHIWGIFAFLISLCGVLIRIVTVGYVSKNTSGRNTTEQRADSLNTSGMYSICRNPLYLGNFIIILGVLLWAKVWFLGIIIALAFFIYMERIIIAEEEYLHNKFQNTYDEWREKTPVFMPNFSLWRSPDLAFSWKLVLRREYPGLLGVSTAFIAMDFIFDIFADREAINEWFICDYPAIITYCLIVTLCLTLRFLKRKTDLLKIEGR